MIENDQLVFESLHLATGSNVDTNFILIPANTTYTFENIYLQSEQVGTMTAFECPNGGLMIAHQKPATSGQKEETQFTGLNAIVSAGSSPVQCVYDRTGAGANEHTYIQVQYYPFDIRENPVTNVTLNYVNFSIELFIIVFSAYAVAKLIMWRNWLSEIIKS